MDPVTVLHLVGSPTSDFYRELSELYARGCVDAVRDDRRYRFVFAHLDPQGHWRFPPSLSARAIEDAPPRTLAQAVDWLAHAAVDIALPQMFCERGVSDIRAVLDLLAIPYLGNRPMQMAIAADKTKAKAIVAAAGVAVPAAVLLHRGDSYDGPLPVVVKPNSADNSLGIALVRDAEQLPAAIAAAQAHAEAVIVERFIPLGREVRCGVIERGGERLCLPLEEYHVDAETRPIRNPADKLKRDDDGALMLAAKTQRESWIVAGDDPIIPAVHAAARAAHQALGFRQYSLFDFRIDPDGRPWFLEAGPYCSFAPDSVIVTMMTATGVPLAEFFATSIADVLAASARG